MKTSRHSLMAKGILVLLSLLILIFVFTYSWYIPPDYPATASGLSLSTSVDADFQMAIGFSTPETGNYVISKFYDNGKIDFERVEINPTVTLTKPNSLNYVYDNHVSETTYVSLLRDFQPVDLTGDGVTLVRPSMELKNRAIMYRADSVSHDLKANEQYISFDLYVRSTAPTFKITLESGSYVVGVCEASNEDLTQLATELANDPNYLTVSKSNEGAAIVSSAKTYSALKGGSVKRKSDYGNFSEDSVVGAVRISFTQYLTTGMTDLGTFFDTVSGKALNNVSYALSGLDNSKTKLWIPRTDIYLQENTSDIHGWVLHTAADADWSTTTVTDTDSGDFDVSSLTYAEAARLHYYYDESKITVAAVNDSYAGRYTQVTTNLLTDLETAEDTTIINGVTAAKDYDNYTYGVCRVNLWVDGTDAEARRAIDGGAFFFGFDLSAT